MNRLIKLFARIIIMLLIFTFICFCINEILEIKHRDKIVNSIKEDWDWKKENDALFGIADKKFTRNKDEENYMLLRRKEFKIPEKEVNEKRILVVGDSYVYGTGGTNINYTWWRQLDLRIKEAGYNNISIYAAGKYGFNTKDELEYILKDDDIIRRIKPDLIIIGYVPNDPENNSSIKPSWELNPNGNKIYEENPALYYELIDRMNSLDAKEYDKLIEIGNMLGYYRWDVRLLYLVQNENYDRYKNELKEVKNRMEELDVPYLFAFTNNFDNILVEKANDIVYNLMTELEIPVYYEEYECYKMLKEMNINDITKLDINPVDNHPGIIWTYDYSKKIYNLLKSNYKFIFENSKKVNIDELELNINDTTPYLKVNKINENVFEFEYPKKETTKTINTNFLYYPLEKNYVKLNLEYPKKISKIKITGKKIMDIEVYVNVIDKKYGFDYDEKFKKLALEIEDEMLYVVDDKITSVNIYATFKDENDRDLKIEFIE